jgi:diguanylate cyclase (GGDEF)-like protein
VRPAWTWTKGAEASRRLAVVQLVACLGGAAWVVRNWGVLPRPALALVGLGAVGVSAFFCWRPPSRANGVIQAALSGAVALCLVGLNGGPSSLLVPLWLAALGAIVLTLPPLVRVQLPSVIVSVPLAVGWRPDTAAIPLALGAAAVAAGAFVVSRRYAEALDRAELESLHDPLTGLPNRRAFDHRLATLSSAAGSPFALLSVDLDGFRHVNNEQGHATGDRLLVAAAHLLNGAAPAGSFPARVGGDEFAIMLEDRGSAKECADIVIGELSGATLPGITLGASVGIAYWPEHGPSLDDLRAAADEALHQAKQRGRGIAVEFDPSLAQEPAAGGADEVRRLWEEDLIDIVVQPIVDIQYGRIRSYEALSRFRVEGDPSPFKWFTLAEQHGLRLELELACLDRALRLLPARPFGTRLSVNAGPELLTHPAGLAMLMDVPDPNGVIIEVTENAVVDDYEHLKEILAPLIERGMSLAVDDFGAGAANMQHVDALAPRYLKLDRSLVDNCAADTRKSAMIEALVRYSWQTDSHLVAEGVETTTDLEHLRRLGVGAAQGYVIARPQPPWPMLEPDAVAVMTLDSTPTVELASVVVQSDELTAAEAQARFARDTVVTAIVLVDGSERVKGLLTRSRMNAAPAEGAALEVADTRPLLVQPSTSRAEIVSRATAREADTRYDPVLVVDERWRLVEAIAIETLLQETSAAAQQGTPAASEPPLRLAADG